MARLLPFDICTTLARLERDGLEEWVREQSPGTRQRRDLDRLPAAGNGDVAEALLIEGAALHLEADLKWLALCEQRLGRSTAPLSSSAVHRQRAALRR